MTTEFGQTNVVLNLLTLAAIITALGVLWRVALSGRRIARLVNQFFDDWNGQPARPGHARRLGIPERLESVEAAQVDIRAELRPNGGGSLRDAVDRNYRATQEGVTALTAGQAPPTVVVQPASAPDFPNPMPVIDVTPGPAVPPEGEHRA